jgi:hypothetical protein
MSVETVATKYQAPPRKVRLTWLGVLIRTVFLFILILFVAAFLAAAMMDGARSWVIPAAFVLVVVLGDYVVLEWYLHRERRRLRDWAMIDVVMWGQQCYGLLDHQGEPLSFSPPITPDVLAKGKKKAVLYDPKNCTRLVDVERRLTVVQLENGVRGLQA